MAVMHHYLFEVWPERGSLGTTDLGLLDGGRMLPEHMSITAAGPDEARTAAREQAGPDKFTILAGHNRARCSPPHPGRENVNTDAESAGVRWQAIRSTWPAI
jgi:hypothetical protein